jgi:hypothetical protein
LDKISNHKKLKTLIVPIALAAIAVEEEAKILAKLDILI